MTSTLPTPPDSAKTAYVGEASARSSDRCFGARLHALLAAGLATLLLSLAVAVRPERTYTALVAIGLPQQGANGAEADADGLALDSAALSTQLAAALQDDAVLVRAAEAAHLRASPAGAAALLKELRAATLAAPNAATADAGAQITVESKNAAEAQALALALAEGFAADYRQRALARGQQAVTEARQAVTDSAAAAQASRHAFDEFLASHFAQAAAPAAAPPAAPPAPAPSAPTPKPAAESPAAVAEAQSEPAGEPATEAALPEETELQRLKQERRQLLVRYTKYHYKVQVVDMHIARLEKELAILAPKRADALPAPKPAEAAPEPLPDAAALSLEAAAQEAAAVAAAEAQAQREQLTQAFATLRAQVDSARAAAEQAVLHERAALEHQATLASQAELRVAPPVVTYRTAEGLDRRGVAWSVLLAATVGGLAFCMTGPQRHVYRTPAEVEDDLELPLVAALASRSAALPRRPKLLPAIAARLTACGELVLVAIVCGLAVLAYLEPDFRSQLIESPLAAYTDAASRLFGR
ncbi:MAG: hypothetical protein U0836_16775 [Pirellulales bacterium]